MGFEQQPLDLEALQRDFDDALMFVGPWSVGEKLNGPVVHDRYGEVILAVGNGHIGGGRPINARLEACLRLARAVVRWRKEVPRLIAELRDARAELAAFHASKSTQPGWHAGP